jgi:glycosyltransferase involved in cell wall biosynthesis
VPVIASDIPGSAGLLGTDYPGLYPVGDTQALAALLQRAESDAAFYDSLDRHCRARRPRFSLAAEAAAWTRLIDDVTRR